MSLIPFPITAGKLPSEKQKKAIEILNHLNLPEALHKYGRAEVVGSTVLDLIVKLDIDIHLLTHNDLTETAMNITRYLLHFDDINQVRVNDYRHMHAIKCAVDNYPQRKNGWSIDIWITNKLENTGFHHAEIILNQLTPKKKEIILEIKRFYNELGQLRDGLSCKIYNAVLNHNVKNLDEFRNFLQKR